MVEAVAAAPTLLSQVGTFMGISVAMQAATAAISIPSQEKRAEETDNAICNQIVSVNKKIDAIQSLRTTLGKDTILNAQTSSMIDSLNTEVSNDINSIKSQKQSSKTRILITIILNIFLLALISIQLFS